MAGLFILSVVGLFVGLGLVRNDRVFGFRQELLTRVSRLATDDIENSRPWFWRYEALQSVGYEEMVYRFWKPLRVTSFWKDTSFLEDVK